MNKYIRKINLFVLILLTIFLNSGCIYRAIIKQGNVFDPEDLAQVEVGMTQNQVRFLLGTPMVDDPFSQNRWDYVFYLKDSTGEAKQKGWVSIIFEDDIVNEIRDEQFLSSEL
tara:strand:- start:1306 stop:1644 length:339 start_codon:yes stop_codon:yes gene_type:complete